MNHDARIAVGRPGGFGTGNHEIDQILSKRSMPSGLDGKLQEGCQLVGRESLLRQVLQRSSLRLYGRRVR